MSSQSLTRRRSQRPKPPSSALSTGKIRCQCETEIDEGEMIECEVCKEWQHTYCMGIIDQNDTKDYQCEICKPRLLLVTRSDARRYQTGGVVPAPKTTRKTQRSCDLDFEELAHFIARECETQDAPVCVNHFFEKAKKHCGFEGAVGTLIPKCRRLMVTETEVMEKFGMDIRAKMFFLISAPVDETFLKDLRKSAKVSIDSAQRIISYESPTAKFEGTPCRITHRPMPGPAERRGRRKPRLSGTSSPNPEPRAPEEDIQLVYNGGFVPVPLKIEPEPPAYQQQMTSFRPPQQMNMAPPPPPFYPMEDRSVINGVASLIQSMSGFIDTQTRFMKEMAKMSVPNPLPAPVPIESRLRIHSFLQYLKMLIKSIDNPAHLSPISQLIDNKITEIGEEREMGQKRLEMAIETILSLTSSTFPQFQPKFQPNYYTKAKNFHNFLFIYASGHNLNGMIQGLCDRLKEKMNRNEEEHISIERLRMAIEAAVGIVSSAF